MRAEEELLAFDKAQPDAPAAALDADEIAFLVDSLARKEDDPRYRALGRSWPLCGGARRYDKAAR